MSSSITYQEDSLPKVLLIRMQAFCEMPWWFWCQVGIYKESFLCWKGFFKLIQIGIWLVFVEFAMVQGTPNYYQHRRCACQCAHQCQGGKGYQSIWLKMYDELTVHAVENFFFQPHVLCMCPGKLCAWMSWWPSRLTARSELEDRSELKWAGKRNLTTCEILVLQWV